MSEHLTLPCDCAGICSIALVTDVEDIALDGPPELFVEMFEHVQAQGLRRRVAVAWAVLRGREPWTHGVCFMGPAKVERLRDFLSDVLEAHR